MMEHRIYILFLFLGLLGISLAMAQPGPIKMFRYSDDFSYLFEKDSMSLTWYEKLKFIPLSRTSNISFGGEVREVYQYFDNQNFGDVPPNFSTATEGFLWHRAMLHTKVNLGRQWGLFAQLNSTFTFFKENPLAPQIDENQLSLHQAFVQYRIGSKGEFVQLGRQEFGQGTQNIIAMREGPNTRLTFDAILLASERAKRRFYAFWATPVQSNQGVFDDDWIDEQIWTLYMVNSLGTTNLDIYYFGFHGSERSYNGITGNENRQTVGLRFWKTSKTSNFSLETNYQFGKIEDLGISAYNLSFTGDLWFSDTMAIGGVFNYISGDQNSADRKLNTYNLLYSRPQFGLAAPLGSVNIVNIRPLMHFRPFHNFMLTLSNYWLWRQSEFDGLYTPGAVQIRPADNAQGGINGKFIGTQSVLELFFNWSTNLKLFADYAIFFPGDYIESTGQGERISYFSLKTSFKF